MAKGFQLKYHTELKLYDYKPILMSEELFLTMYWIEGHMFVGVDKKRASDLPKAEVIGNCDHLTWVMGTRSGPAAGTSSMCS